MLGAPALTRPSRARGGVADVAGAADATMFGDSRWLRGIRTDTTAAMTAEIVPPITMT
jgi:hypothetical protein